jgi:hypothetical protein
MSAAQPNFTEAVESLARRSRISAIATLVIAITLLGALLFLTIKIGEKRQALDDLQRQEAAAHSRIDQLNAEVARLASQRDQIQAQTKAATEKSIEASIQQVVQKASPTTRHAVLTVFNEARVAHDKSGAGKLVYLQYSDPSALAVMRKIQSALIAQNFVAPGIEHVRANQFEILAPNEVKYFHADDAQIARNIAKTAAETLAGNCTNPPRVIVPRKPAYSKRPATTTQIEVWISAPCAASGTSPPH